jgi:hypothetical protein
VVVNRDVWILSVIVFNACRPRTPGDRIVATSRISEHIPSTIRRVRFFIELDLLELLLVEQEFDLLPEI